MYQNVFNDVSKIAFCLPKKEVMSQYLSVWMQIQTLAEVWFIIFVDFKSYIWLKSLSKSIIS
jgi:hypothetical protein